uniref:Uncharacterized protein n=1 Tax=Arundo donax TaxID=35708 RepID=A0A0A9GXQ1_ARUDO
MLGLRDVASSKVVGSCYFSTSRIRITHFGILKFKPG